MRRIYVFVDDVRSVPRPKDEFGLPQRCAQPEDCQETLTFRSYEEFFHWLEGDTTGKELVLSLDHDMGYHAAANINGKQGVMLLRTIWEQGALPPIVRACVHSWNPDGSRDMAEILHGMGIPTTREMF